MLRYIVSSHFSLINRVAVDAPTSAVLCIEGPRKHLPLLVLSSHLQNRAEAINLHLAWVGTGPNTVTQTELGQHAFILEPSRARHV